MKKHIVIVKDEFFNKHLDIFQNSECKVAKTVIEDDLFKDDPIYEKLLKAKKKAEKELRDYEYDQRYK
jgi:hypothetical protein